MKGRCAQTLGIILPAVLAHPEKDHAPCATPQSGQPREVGVQQHKGRIPFRSVRGAGKEKQRFRVPGLKFPGESQGVRGLVIEHIPVFSPVEAQAQPWEKLAADELDSQTDERGQNSDAAQGENQAQKPAGSRNRSEVAVTDGGHGDQREPDRIPESLYGCTRGSRFSRNQQNQQKKINQRGGQEKA